MYFLANHFYINDAMWYKLVWGQLSCPEVQVSDHGMVLPVQESSTESHICSLGKHSQDFAYFVNVRNV